MKVVAKGLGAFVSVYALIVIVLNILCVDGAFHAQAQTIFNTVAVTSNGQFVNAQLTDNVYVDMASSPPKLKARRPLLNVRPVEQADNSWLIPVNVPMLPGYQVQVISNGLELTQDVDYKFDLVNSRRIIPIGARWHYLKEDGSDAGAYLVKVHIFP